MIDGYNVTKDARGVRSAGLPDQRTWLARLVSGLTGRFDIRPLLVFDGTAEVGTRPPQARGVIVRFTEDEPVDELLVTLVDMAAVDEPVLVVTSDREIRNAVGAAGANSVPSGAFLEAATS